ncbi:UDP-glucuronosyl/UDP-glucosyltransferase [Parasponia andersonii]|uniref:UDP-glucuronosyl/UDP-glucosyltransferase n=1 Tax=Parasponia andersonii TaxID=3476 RepID=A0A2P5AQD5_PARAD|nr:UDP-glucuronosyl/UDP-glucosyltransferase [Parasponia andersonii]
MFHFQALYDENGVDPTEFQDDVVTEFVMPCFVEPVPATALQNSLVLKGWAQLLFHHTRRTREAKGIFVNSFTEHESHAFLSLSNVETPPVYPVRPILECLQGGACGSLMSSSGLMISLPLR